MPIRKIPYWIWWGGKEIAPGGRSYDEVQKHYNDWACNCACGQSLLGMYGRDNYSYCPIHYLFGVEP